MTLEPEDMRKLRAPFALAAVKFRPLEKPGRNKSVSCLCYIDSRLASERLSAVDAGWSSTYEVLAGPDQHMPVVCRLTVCGVTREGVGQNASAVRDEKHAKTAFSDALKRAAVEFGVGASLYAMPQMSVPETGYWMKQNGKVGGLTALGIRDLRQQYQRAIAQQAFVDRYGAPIDHGDYLLPEEALADPGPTTVDEAEAVPRLDERQLAVLEAISDACGHPGKDRSDLLAEDFLGVYLPQILQFAVKQEVLSAAAAEDVSAAASELDVAKVLEIIAGERAVAA